MKLRRIIGIVLMSVVLAACGTVKIDPKDNVSVSVNIDKDRVIRNPLNGWVVYATGDLSPELWDGYDSMKVPGLDATVRVSDFSNTLYLRTSWTIFNPEEDVYGWDVNEGFKYIIDYAKERGLKLAFRVVVDSRDKPYDFTPKFVRDAGAEGFESKSGSKTVWSPYCDDPVFQEKHAKFIKAFAKRFDDSDEVDFIDGYGLGKWGESHAVAYKDDANREKVYKWIIDLYTDNFKEVPLAINYHRLIGTSVSWAEVDANSEPLLDYAVNKGYILRHDAFGMTDYYPEWEKNYAKKWTFKRPILMEGGWIVKNHHRYWVDPRGYKTPYDVRKGEFDDSKEAHVNTMDFRIRETNTWFESAETFKLVKEFVSKGGYRIAPDFVSLPPVITNNQELLIKHQWVNLGWGYCPTNIPQWKGKYKVAFALLDSETNKPVSISIDDNAQPSDWLQGKPTAYELRFTLNDVPKGKYYWAVGIIDTKKNNKIGINLAATEEMLTKDGWLKLVETEFKVSSTN